MTSFLSALPVGIRESIEAGLIFFLIYSVCKEKKIKIFKIHLYIALAIGIMLSIFFGIIVYNLPKTNFYSQNENLVGAIIMLLISFTLIYFVVWMIKINVREEKIKIQNIINKSSVYGIYIAVILNIFREGIEIVLFIYPSLSKQDFTGVFGSMTGVLVGIIILLIFSLSSRKIRINYLLKILTWFLIVQTAYIFSGAIEKILKYAEVYENDIIFNIEISYLNKSKSIIGNILNFTIGYRNKMNLYVLISQLIVFTSLLLLFIRTEIDRTKKKPKPASFFLLDL
jgi:FTR1 family protein